MVKGSIEDVTLAMITIRARPTAMRGSPTLPKVPSAMSDGMSGAIN